MLVCEKTSSQVPAPHTAVPLSLHGSLESTYSDTKHAASHVKRTAVVMVAAVVGEEGQKAPKKKSFPRWRASQKRKMDVLQKQHAVVSS